ncbi:MAG: hypothetical protein CTY16_12020 [Methylobacter sp.]|nr:MAG: hypothetical protein CTY16_12020 [Methylobacter sp.]
MNNKGFLEAQKIEPSLKGFMWPETMDIPTISNLHFHDNAIAKRNLLELLTTSVKKGTVNFDRIHIHSSVERPSNVAVSCNGREGAWLRLNQEMMRQNDERVLDAHEPADGWVKLLQGMQPFGTVNLTGHPCGCKAECTLNAIFTNRMPKRWEAQVFHDDRSLALIRLSYRAVPLLTASQYLGFCAKNSIPCHENPPLSGWLDTAKTKATLVSCNDQSKPSCGTKAIHKPLNAPARQDDWFDAISDMMEAFVNEFGKMPNETQAWGMLSDRPPVGYIINKGQDKGEDCLKMPGTKPLSQSSFSKRWTKYTADKP